jgi:folate-binding protein YgfZ
VTILESTSWHQVLRDGGYDFDESGAASLAAYRPREDAVNWMAPLTSQGALRISGRDTRKFLQAQLTADIDALAPGDHVLAAWCDPKGRAQALFLVVAEADDVLTLHAPRAVLDAVTDRLKLYVMRAKAKFDRLDDTIAILGLNSEFPDTSSFDGLVLVDFSGQRRLVYGLTSTMELLHKRLGDSCEAADERQWWLAAIVAGQPQIWPETMGDFVPQMMNLELLGGVSFAKGCYPGQEVVARTQYLGKVKRRTFRASLVSDHPIPAGTQVRTPGGDLAGEVMQSVSLANNTQMILVVLRHTSVESGEPLLANDALLTLQDLPYSYEPPVELTAPR